MQQGDERSVVIGVLLHVADLSSQPSDVVARVVESVRPIVESDGIWQAGDHISGAFWIVAIGHNLALSLESSRAMEPNWRPYPEQCPVSVSGTPALCASFHDKPWRLSPPRLLRIGRTYIYKNPSGSCVQLGPELVGGILSANGAE